MTSRILIRCDASLSIGSGHVIRCRTLARQLKRQGGEVLFICRRQTGDLIDLLQQEFEVVLLPELPLQSCEGLAGRDLYRAWLGCSQAQDSVDFLEALDSAGIDNAAWLIADHYGLDADWEARVLEGLHSDDFPKLLVIDDLADRPHRADLLLDQNFFGEATDQRYLGLVPSHCRQFLGPHYALLGQEYTQFHPLVTERTELHRVLVFFGGVDPDNLTGRTLEALMDPELAQLSVDVVIGRESPHRQTVADQVALRPGTTLHNPLPSLAVLIARADLAIGACGSTTWERACLKVPSLVVAIAANQVTFAQALHQAGHLQLLGDALTVSTESIRSALLDRIGNPVRGDVGGNLTDGFGAARLALAILGRQASIGLRLADERDEALLLRWAADPQVQTSGVSPDLTKPSDHDNSNRLGLANPSQLLLIAE